jgi:hypothetical protein
MKITNDNAWGIASMVVAIGALAGSMIAWRHAATSANEASEARRRATSLEARTREAVANEGKYFDAMEQAIRLLQEDDPQPAPQIQIQRRRTLPVRGGPQDQQRGQE